MKSFQAVLIAGIVLAASAAGQDFPKNMPDLSRMPDISKAMAEASKAMKGAAKAMNSAGYSAGTRALDEHKYEEAVRDFDRVITSKSDKADGALYWKAYALNRLGRRDDAIEAIAALRRDFPKSRWLGDAKVLEADAQQGAGKPISPADESNEDLKLMAINGLLNADPARALPLLDGVMKGSGSPKLKDRAMFVLTQNRSPEAKKLLVDYAKGGANPDLQLRAIRYIGMGGGADSRQQLTEIYRAAGDVEVKRAVLQSLAMSGGYAAVLEVAQSDQDPAMRREAVRDLAMASGMQPDSLVKLYSLENDATVKKEVINAIFMRGDAKDLIDMARKESNPAMKKTIVERLSMMRNNKEATEYMLELLK